MGKGGKTDSALRQRTEKKNELEWKSPYNPLDPKAPELPTKGQIKAVIPKHCFERSYIWGMAYLIRDFIIAAAFVYGTSQVLSTDLPSLGDPLAVATWVAGWSFYAFWMGTIMTGPWVIAHECGHGAFSPSQTWNDIVGFIVHQVLLVPYFAWQYTHAKHHRRTNHLTDGESHVPSTKTDNGLGENNERLSFYAVMHEAMGDGVFAGFQVWSHLAIGWPLYLLGLASTGKLDQKGQPLQGIADHFRPSSPMFPEKLSFKIFLSTATVVASLGGLGYASYEFGFMPVLLWYLNPYFFVNAWLVLYTWLQHTDASVPQYGDDEWTWVKGALSTVDRPYGIFDFFHHEIGSTHVAHHLFHEMPHYNALEATHAIKAFLEPKGLYNYNPTPWWKAMWQVAKTCHYVEDTTGVQYYKSLEDIPLTKDLKKKAA
jgi:omega-6 fatty acid desaturase (delta-12 desaturase)